MIPAYKNIQEQAEQLHYQSLIAKQIYKSLCEDLERLPEQFIGAFLLAFTMLVGALTPKLFHWSANSC